MYFAPARIQSEAEEGPSQFIGAGKASFRTLESSCGLTTQNDNVYAAVLRSPLRGEIARDRVVFRVAGGRKPFGREAVAEDEKPNQFRRPRGRKLPVGCHLGGVNRNVVSVSFDAQLLGADSENRGDAIQC